MPAARFLLRIRFNKRYQYKSSIIAKFSGKASDREVIQEDDLKSYLQEAHGVAAERDADIEGHDAVKGAGFLSGTHSAGEYITAEDMAKFTKKSSYPKGYGVFRENEKDDLDVMANYFTVPALAKALRDRETALQMCSKLIDEDDIESVREMLKPYRKENVMKRRSKRRPLDLSTSFSRNDLVILQRYLHRMPRQVFQAREKRASVVIPLCNDNGVASILFQRRAMTMSRHKGEVCFPGGMVDEDADSTIIQTSLRETSEELGLPADAIDVLGILRCNWDEVEHMTGVAVTPVVGFLGELNDIKLHPNADEVEEYFTVPLTKLLSEDKWKVEEGSAPVFIGGPFVIWGLTGYLLRRFLRDVVRRTHLTSYEIANQPKLPSYMLDDATN